MCILVDALKHTLHVHMCTYTCRCACTYAFTCMHAHITIIYTLLFMLPHVHARTFFSFDSLMKFSHFPCCHLIFPLLYRSISHVTSSTTHTLHVTFSRLWYLQCNGKCVRMFGHLRVLIRATATATR